MANDLQFSPSLLWMTPFIPNQTGMLLATLKPFPTTISSIPPPVITGGVNYEYKPEVQPELSEQTESETSDVVIEPEVSKTVDNLSIIIEDIIEAEELVEPIDSQETSSELNIEVNDARYEQKKDIVATSTKLVSADYQCITDDFYVGVNSNSATKITLPLNPKDGTMIIIKAEMQSLHSNKKVTIMTGDDSVIDGSSRYFISKPYGVARLMYRDGNWYSV